MRIGSSKAAGMRRVPGPRIDGRFLRGTRHSGCRPLVLPTVQKTFGAQGFAPRTLAGVRYDVQQNGRRGKPELVLITFTTRGTALVPSRAARGARQAPVLRAAVGT